MKKTLLEFDTICAISTPAGQGAIAVIRISGEDAFDVCEKIFRTAKNVTTKWSKPGACLLYGRIFDEEEIRMALYPDDVAIMSAYLQSKNYFSGERYLIEEVLRKAGNNKTRAAQALGIERSTLWRRMKKYGMLH